MKTVTTEEFKKLPEWTLFATEYNQVGIVRSNGNFSEFEIGIGISKEYSFNDLNGNIEAIWDKKEISHLLDNLRIASTVSSDLQVYIDVLQKALEVAPS